MPENLELDPRAKWEAAVRQAALALAERRFEMGELRLVLRHRRIAAGEDAMLSAEEDDAIAATVRAMIDEGTLREDGDSLEKA
jgi:hypothetical protein